MIRRDGASAAPCSGRVDVMHEKVIPSDPTAAPISWLDALANDLIGANDEEIFQAAKDLVMNPKMKGSAVFAGLQYPINPRLSDFYDLDLERNLPISLEQWARQVSKDADE